MIIIIIAIIIPNNIFILFCSNSKNTNTFSNTKTIDYINNKSALNKCIQK